MSAARRFSRALALCAAAGAALSTPGCGPSSSASGAPTASAVAARPPPPETTLFAPVKSILVDLPVMKLVPRTVTAVLVARDPAGALAKLTALQGFGEAQDPLAREIDAAARDLTKDLPELAALAQNGVDLAKPVGVLWADHDFDTMAIFAAVSDEAAMKRWIDERAKQSKGKREVLTVGDAIVLRAKHDVTRAVVLRGGHVFWVRTRDRYNLPEDRVVDAADALAKTAEADSLGADPAFAKAAAALSFGAEAALYLNAVSFAEGVLAARKSEIETAQEALDEEQAKLARAEKRKHKGAIDEAKTAVDAATRKKAEAERRAKDAEVFALLKDAVPGVAAGVAIGEREIKLKAFVPVADAVAVKVLAPIREPVAVFDPALLTGTAAHFALDPRLLAFVMERFSQRSIHGGGLPLWRARSALRNLGVEPDELEPLFDGEVSAATHTQKIEIAAAASAAAATAPSPSASSASAASPSASSAPATASSAAAAAPTVREREGFTVMWGVSDAARAKAVLDEAWKAYEGSERAAKGSVKRLAEGSFEIVPAYSGDLATRVRLAGSAFVVTTQPALADGLGDAAAKPTWMAASDHPTLKQLASIEGPRAILTFDGSALRSDSLWDSAGILGSMSALRSFGLFGSSSPKGKKLREQRDKLDDQRRALDRALDKQKDLTWKSFAPRIGTVALFAKPVDGGVAIYGGLFTPEPSVSALAEAALAAWLSVGPRWEKWAEKAELEKKLRDVDALIEADAQKAMDDMVGDVMRGLGTSDRPFTSGSLLGGSGSRGPDDPKRQ